MTLPAVAVVAGAAVGAGAVVVPAGLPQKT